VVRSNVVTVTVVASKPKAARNQYRDRVIVKCRR